MKFILAILALVSLALAVDKEDMEKLVEESTWVVKDLKLGAEGIPEELLKKARGVIVCPGLIKGAFIFGGGGGNCTVSYRNPTTGEWSAPAFYTLAHASVGFQIGVESVDLLLVVNTDRGMRSLLRNKVKLGADLSVAAGPAGRSASASTDLALKADIYSYSKAKGIFAGVSLQGAVLIPYEDGIFAYYGKHLTPKEILFGKVQMPPSAVKFTQTLKASTVRPQP